VARFDKQIATAKRLIAKNGEVVSLIVETTSALPDPLTPWIPGSFTKQTKSVASVWLDYDIRYLSEGVIQKGDQKVLIPSTDINGGAITLTMTNTIIRSGDAWKVVNFQPLAPNGQLILYELQVRR